MPPVGDASTGSPLAMASTQVFGKFSQRDGTTAIRARFRYRETADRATCP
jgi:hypothetical protein